MIPRNLQPLVRDAIANEWDVDVRRGYGPSFDARFRRFDGTTTSTVRVEWWPSGRSFKVDTSTINNTPTPYAQCVRLIRSKETS